MQWTAIRSLCNSLALCIVALAGGAGGCGLFGPPFPSGTYSGDIPCTLTVGEGDAAETGSFESPISLNADDSGGFVLNGAPVEVGEQITFSTPTADLGFEIVSIARVLSSLAVTFEPRPTLPGISIDGNLVETFSLRSTGIHVTAEAVLDVTDTSGTTRLGITCDGTLVRE